MSRVSSYVNFKSFIQKKTIFYKIEKFKSVEIDDLEDYRMVKKLYDLIIEIESFSSLVVNQGIDEGIKKNMHKQLQTLMSKNKSLNQNL